MGVTDRNATLAGVYLNSIVMNTLSSLIHVKWARHLAKNAIDTGVNRTLGWVTTNTEQVLKWIIGLSASKQKSKRSAGGREDDKTSGQSLTLRRTLSIQAG